MARPSEQLAKHRKEVLAIIECYPVTNPRLFGSVARGEDTDTSDIDILVDPQRGGTTLIDLANIELRLEALLGFPVDVRTPREFGTDSSDRLARDLRSLE